jgi:hypothetical protein
MARLICRACREAVVPGDLICEHCRANLTAADAVVDELAVDPTRLVAPDDTTEAGDDEPATDDPDGNGPGGAGADDGGAACPHCGAGLSRADTVVCEVCLTSLGGALVLRLGGDSGWRHEVLPGGSLLLGRDPTSPAAAVLARHDTVSRRHARVSVDHSHRASVTDLDSTNGTFVDDVPVRLGTPVELRPGARLRLGSSVSITVETT